MSKRTTNFTNTELICTQCGNKQIIIRLLNKLHKAGHNKHIWCINCKKDTLHKENPIHKESLEKYNIK